jgi:hypothetical protein
VGDDSIVLKPFIDTVTYPNVTESGSAVVNLTDDVRVFARSAIGNPDLPSFPAERIRGAVLADCCSWREVEVESVDNTPPRARVSTRIVHRGLRREFIGFNRASHAVLEATIYATRLHILPRDFVESELERLRIIVDKTAGPREYEAMETIVSFVRGMAVTDA